MPGSQEVFELMAGGDPGIVRITIRQHQFRALQGQRVCHPGWFVVKGPGLWSFLRETAGIGHWCREIAVQYLRVACAATGVRGADRRYHFGRLLGKGGDPTARCQCQCQGYSPISIDPA
jgi:hypothetical protein